MQLVKMNIDQFIFTVYVRKILIIKLISFPISLSLKIKFPSPLSLDLTYHFDVDGEAANLSSGRF